MESRESVNAVLSSLLSGTAGPPAPRPARPAGGLELSVMFFSDVSQALANPYQLVFDLCDFADKHGFTAVWVPERHFHPFGGIYPSPAVLAAALAVRTRRLRIRSGSVVLPLHHPAEVVEAWSMVDNLSNGRVDLGLASGWDADDFVLSPETFATHREVWHERIPLVQRLWRGERQAFPNGRGELKEIRVYPAPVQKEITIWLTATKSDESFIHAGRHGYNVLTMLQGIDLEQLGAKVRLYRDARREAGWPAAGGVVTLMLHTFVHGDLRLVEQAVREPFTAYIKSALTGHIKHFRPHEAPTEEELDKIVDYSYERYFKTGALFGSVGDARAFAQQALAVGVNEIACLMDFGVDYRAVLESLPHLAELQDQLRGATAPAAPR